MPVYQEIRFSRQWISTRKKTAYSASESLFYQKSPSSKIVFSEADSEAGNPLHPTCLIQANPQKAIFYIIERACPTNGSDCGSLCSHNLTLFVRLLYYSLGMIRLKIKATKIFAPLLFDSFIASFKILIRLIINRLLNKSLAAII